MAANLAAPGSVPGKEPMEPLEVRTDRGRQAVTDHAVRQEEDIKSTCIMVNSWMMPLPP